MAIKGRSDEPVREDGMYVCADGCERRHYREGDRFLTCAVAGGPTTWIKVEDV
jgi:hypothetical protein